MEIELEHDEIVLFGLLTAFALIWVVFAMPYLENAAWFLNLNPVFQYFLFNIGFIMFGIILINLPYRLQFKERIEFLTMLKLGISGWLIFSFIFDLWQPPYYLSSAGQVLITNQQALFATSIDAMLTYVWSFLLPVNLGINGISFVYMLVYFVTPILALTGMMFMLKPDAFRRLILNRS